MDVNRINGAFDEAGFGFDEIEFVDPLEPSDEEAHRMAMEQLAAEERRKDEANHKPADQPRKAPPPKFKRFPVKHLPDPMRSFVKEASAAIGCDESFVALPLLSCVGSAIGNTCRLVVKSGWHAPPAIWTMIVAESGTAKSPAFKAAKASVQRHQRRLLETHDQRFADFELEQEEYEGALKRHRQSKSTEPPPDKPVPPTAERVVVSDTTVEALAQVLSHNPRGVLLLRDELAGWLGSFNAYKASRGADEANWLQMFDGDALCVDRKNEGSRPTFVPSALVSITGGIQPDVLSKLMDRGKRASGMSSRFLFASPPRRPQKWSDDEVGDKTQSAVDEMFGRLYEIPFAEDGEPHYVGMDREAKSLYVEFFNQHHDEQADLVGDEARAWSKLVGYVPRLALVFHVVRQVMAGLPITDSVGADCIEAAIGIVAWSKNEAERIYGSIDATDDERDLYQVAEWIGRKHDGECTPSQLVQGVRHIRNRQEADQIIRQLVRAGLAETETYPSTNRGGHPKHVVRLI